MNNQVNIYSTLWKVGFLFIDSSVGLACCRKRQVTLCFTNTPKILSHVQLDGFQSFMFIVI